MNYFVFIENTNYYLWQLDILIESLKHHNINANLVVALKDNNEQKLPIFGRNIRFCNKFLKHNDKFSALFFALENKILCQLFTLLEPDSILVTQPLLKPENIVFSIDKTLYPLDDIQDYINNILTIKKLNSLDFYTYIGDTITFNDLPLPFFKRIVEWQNILKNDKHALILTLLEYYGHISILGTRTYETQLFTNDLVDFSFVRYNKGFYPFFAKDMFKYQPPDFFALGNVFYALTQCNLTTTTNLIQPVVQSLWAASPTQKGNFNINEIKPTVDM